MGSKRGWTILLSLVLVVAVALCIGLWKRHEERQTALQQVHADLELSQEAWQGISAEKEALEAAQSEVEDGLREASLALQESLDKAESIRLQLATLSDLREEKEQTAAAYEQEADVLNGLLLELENADKALQAAYDAVQQAQAGEATATLDTLRSALRDVLLSRRAALEWLLDDGSVQDDSETHSSLCLMLVDNEARLGELEVEDEEISGQP